MNIKAIHLLNTIDLFGLYDQKSDNTHESREFKASDVLSITEEGNDVLFSFEVDGRLFTTSTPKANVRFIIYQPQPIKKTKKSL